MSYPKRQLRLKPRRGVASDLPGWSVPNDYYTQAENIVFRQGVAERAPSSEAVYDPPSVAPYHLLNALIGGINYWIYAGLTASYAVTGSTHTDITHASGQQSQSSIAKLSLGLLNGVPFFNNALDEPMYWDGNTANNFVDLPGWTATEVCEFMIAHRYHLFAFGIDGPSGDFPEQLKWSAAASPGSVPSSWTAAATNDAGSAELADTPGPIISAANLRGALGIYKQSSMYLGNYIGERSEEIYEFRPAFSQLGALCRHAVADVNGQHFVVTDGDIVMTDGQAVRQLAQNRRRRFLFNQLDQDNFQNLFVVYNRKQGEVWLCFPESGNTYATRAMIYDVANDAWGDRELPTVAHAAMGTISDTTVSEAWDDDSNTWDSDLTAWNEQAFSLASADLVVAVPGDTELRGVGRGNESLTSLLAKYGIDCGDPERFKFLKRLHLRVEGDTGIDFSVRVGTQQTSGGAITWGSTQTYNSDSGFVNLLAMGRFFNIEITVSTASAFKITGLDLEYEQRGYH